MGDESATMKRTPIIPIKWINDQHDTDGDGVPNYRDCNPWNPWEQGLFHRKKKRVTRNLTNAPERYDTVEKYADDFFLKYASNLRVWAFNAKPIKHKDVYNYLKNTIISRVPIGRKLAKFTNKEISETMAYLKQKENTIVEIREKNGDPSLYLVRDRTSGRPKKSPPTKTEKEQQDQYWMKRDTLALKMYNKHYVSLTSQEKRNVTKEFNMT